MKRAGQRCVINHGLGKWPGLRTGVCVLCLTVLGMGLSLAATVKSGQIDDANHGHRHLTGKVIAIIDGDTLTVLDREQKTWRIRLAGIDAPEKGQPFGERARQSLGKLVFGKEVSAECPEQDRYGRVICTVRLGNRDINREQVEGGMAWVFRRYTSNPEYYRSEEIARRERRGLWSDPQPVPPWEWRKTRKRETYP